MEKTHNVNYSKLFLVRWKKTISAHFIIFNAAVHKLLLLAVEFLQVSVTLNKRKGIWKKITLNFCGCAYARYLYFVIIVIINVSSSINISTVSKRPRLLIAE